MSNLFLHWKAAKNNPFRVCNEYRVCAFLSWNSFYWFDMKALVKSNAVQPETISKNFDRIQLDSTAVVR